ncbi:cyclophilin-like fold protein [Mucilaginibacter sp. UC70_90]
MKVTIGNRSFTATLYDNPAAKAFKAMLPITVDMTELNGNEKYFDLPRGLPVNAAGPGTIHNGNFMLYGSSTLVLFYKEFSTSYSYTKLGLITDTTGLASALGSGNIKITFQLK